jgi:hypothetical protein
MSSRMLLLHLINIQINNLTDPKPKSTIKTDKSKEICSISKKQSFINCPEKNFNINAIRTRYLENHN